MERFLPSYVRQRCAQIIIVDDEASNPIKMEVVEKIQSEAPWCQLRVIRNKKPLSAQLNRMAGVRVSNQPYVYLGQDDSYVADGHIQNLYQHIQKGVADIVATTWVHTSLPDARSLEDAEFKLPEVGSAAELVSYFTFYFFGHSVPRHPIRVPWLIEAALMPRSIFDEAAFDPEYKGNSYRDETDFFLSAAASGARLAFVPGPPAFHYKGPLNKGGGFYVRSGIRHLLWYEYWTFVNTIRFLRKQRRNLEKLGCSVHPYAHTGILMLTRVREWPARFRGR